MSLLPTCTCLTPTYIFSQRLSFLSSFNIIITSDSLNYKSPSNFRSGRSARTILPGRSRNPGITTALSSHREDLATPDTTQAQDQVADATMVNTKDASIVHADDEEAGWLAVMGIDKSDYAIEPLSTEIDGIYGVEEPEEDNPPCGRKRMRSQSHVERADFLEEAVVEPDSASPGGEVQIPSEVEKPATNCRTLEDFAQRPEIPNRTCRRFAKTFDDQMREPKGALGPGATMPNPPSRKTVHNTSNESFLWTHAAGSGPQEELNSSESAIVSPDVDSNDDDFPLPDFEYNNNFLQSTHRGFQATYFNGPDAMSEADITRASFMSIIASREPPRAENALGEFLEKCITTTQALHAKGKGSPASNAKIKEIQRIMGEALTDEKKLDEIDLSNWPFGMK